MPAAHAVVRRCRSWPSTLRRRTRQGSTRSTSRRSRSLFVKRRRQAPRGFVRRPTPSMGPRLSSAPVRALPPTPCSGRPRCASTSSQRAAHARDTPSSQPARPRLAADKLNQAQKVQHGAVATLGRSRSRLSGPFAPTEDDGDVPEELPVPGDAGEEEIEEDFQVRRPRVSSVLATSCARDCVTSSCGSD
jgi:hypothetical protein